jgi:tetratricopeptide (TPR) repeat protein
MNQEETNSLKIQRYLDEDMSEAERLEFEKELQQDPALESLADTYRNLSNGIRYHARQNAWNTIQKLEQQFSDEEIEITTSRGKFWPVFAVAASVSILVIGLAYIINLNLNNSNRLFEDHFTPYQALVHAPTRSEETPLSLKERAFSAYSNENYHQAISIFEEVNAQEDDPLIWFYLGNSNLAIDNPEVAIEYFQKVLSEQTPLTPQAQWYLGLSYLAKGNKDEAEEIFGALARDTSSYGERAQSILNQL